VSAYIGENESSLPSSLIQMPVSSKNTFPDKLRNNVWGWEYGSSGKVPA
jgi:hypothetical protein